jgi:hypothetical protein
LRLKRFGKILCPLLLTACAAIAQDGKEGVSVSGSRLKMNTLYKTQPIRACQWTAPEVTLQRIVKNVDKSTEKSLSTLQNYRLLNTSVPMSTYYNSIGIFCQGEIKLQRVTYVPIRLRLGSYDYVNYLEGK